MPADCGSLPHGESSNAHDRVRVSKLEWFTGIRDQCVSRGIPFHFKQWGNRHESGEWNRDKSYRLLAGVEWNEFPFAQTNNSRKELTEGTGDR